MALVRREHCSACETETLHINGSCVECSSRKKRQADAAWQALSIEEKLTDIKKRLERLEEPPARYCSTPIDFN